MLQPNKDWCWYFDQTTQRLAISLGEDMMFITPYSAKQLANAAQQEQPFGPEDWLYYIQIGDQLAQFEQDFNVAQQTQIALNAVAVKRFYKAQMPKSWYFNRQSYCGTNAGLAILENCEGQGLVLSIEADERSTLCMLISEKMVLDAEKTLQQFAVIKVMNDYLYPFLADDLIRQYA